MRDPEAVGRAVLANLVAHRERRRAESQALRATIARLAAADDGPNWGRASRIRARLPAPRPSLRTVQWHMKSAMSSRLRDFSRERVERAEHAI